MRTLAWGAWWLVVVMLAACGDDDAGGGHDAATDSAMTDPDAQRDAAMEADVGADAAVATDAALDADVDAMLPIDAGVDAPSELEGGIDAMVGADADVDAAVESDAGVDSTVDADAGVDAAVGSDGQEAYLKASNTGSSDELGFTVAVSGDTVVVGAPEEDSWATGVDRDQNNNNAAGSGAAYVYARSNGAWTQQAYLKASNTGTGDGFGLSVAASGNTIVVGAPYEDSAATGLNGDELNNNVVSSGAVYVFIRDGETWEQQAYLKASNPGMGDYFGVSVALSGDTLVVGALFEDSGATGANGDQADNGVSGSGAAYVFVRDNGIWAQQAYLKASNTGEGDRFGHSVAASGDTIVVGAVQESSAATGVDGDQADNTQGNSGAAYVFVRSGSVWTQQAYLKASNTSAGDYFGYSVGASGDVIVVGAAAEDSNATGINGNQSNDAAIDSGAVYVFARDSGAWSQQAYLKASNTGGLDRFGGSVAVSGQVVLVGASTEDSDATGIDGSQDSNTASNSGAAYAFARSGSDWSQVAYLKASNGEAGDNFGASVATSGVTWVVGAIGESSNDNGINGNQASNSATAAGAAYVFRNVAP